MDPNDTQATEADAPVQTDTADTQASEANEVTNEAPETTQATEAQEASTTEVNATDTADEKLYAGKYKTPEEMEKAYKSLETKFGQTASEKAELARTLNQAFAAPTGGDDGFEEFDTVNQEIEGLKRVTAVQSFIMSHNDADAQAMQKVLAEDPLVKQISGHDAKLEYAYLRSQNMARPKAIAEAEKRAADTAVAKVAEKTSAQVETARKTEKTDQGDELFSKATGNHPQDVRDAARRELIKKHLVNL